MNLFKSFSFTLMFLSGTLFAANVNSVKVVRDEIVQKITLAGFVESKYSSIIAAPYDGYVKKIFVKVGDKVKVNDPLVSVMQSLVSDEKIFPIRSPINGTIVQITRNEGQSVPANSQSDYIMRIDDLNNLNVSAKVTELDFNKIKQKQECLIKSTAVMNKIYHGDVSEIHLAASKVEGWDRGQVEFKVKINVKDFDTQVKPGMTVMIDLVTAKKEKILVLPHEYIFEESGEYYAKLVSGEKKLIKIGIQNENLSEISSGLKEGDEVVMVDFKELEN